MNHTFTVALSMIIAGLCLLGRAADAAEDGFYAYHNGPDQTGIPSNTYTKPVYGTLKYDTTGGYNTATDTWTPVPIGGTQKIIHTGGQIWIVGGAGFPPYIYNPGFVAKVYKGLPGVYSNADVCAGIGLNNKDMPGVAIINFDCDDLAQPGEQYNVELYATASPYSGIPFPASPVGTVMLDNNMAHMFWYGSVEAMIHSTRNNGNAFDNPPSVQRLINSFPE